MCSVVGRKHVALLLLDFQEANSFSGHFWVGDESKLKTYWKPIITIYLWNNHPLTSCFRVPSGCRDVDSWPVGKDGWPPWDPWTPTHQVPTYCGWLRNPAPVDRRKFRSQTSDNMERWKAEQGRGRREKIRREKIRRERVRRKKMQMREKVGKSRNTVFFQWFVAPEGRKVGSLKRRVRSQLARWEMKNCTPLWREAHFEVKMYKTHHGRTTFGSWDVEKLHAVVARSTFRSENVQSTPWSDHFWKLRCRKSARRCGAKHISKSKVLKTGGLGPLLEVEMSKKWTPLWREAHFEVKSAKNWRSRTTFGSWDVEKVHAVVARSTFRSQKCKKLMVLSLFWRYDVEKVDTD